MKNNSSDPQNDIFRATHGGTLITLPPAIHELPNGFTIHQGNRVAFHGKEIKLEPQQARFAVEIMKQPVGYITEKGELLRLLGDLYVDGDREYETVERRYKDIIYRLNKAFASSTGITHKFFVSKSKFGYWFNPNF